MKILVDTDVIIDLFLDRAPFANEAKAILKAIEQGLCEGYISGITPINLFYIGRKVKGKDEAWKAVQKLVTGFQVCSVDTIVLQTALALAFSDYEDAVQHACATVNSLNAIVTRNLDDYKAATITVYNPADFLQQLKTS